MALKFLNKKGWHTGSLRNIENVWKAEQKHDAEQKKLEELRKQIQDERERSEFRLLQEQAGLVPRQERLEFLYDSGLAVGKGSSSSGAGSGVAFKALEETIPNNNNKTADPSSSASTGKQSSAPGALFEDKPHSANDAWRKLHSDPLLLIRQREQEALARIKNNPVQMALIRKSVKANKEEKAQEKTERRKKHSHGSAKHHKHSSSKAESDSEDSYVKREKKRQTGDHRGSKHEEHYYKAEVISNDNSSGRESRRRRDSKYRERSPSGFSDSKAVKNDGNHAVKKYSDKLTGEKNSLRDWTNTDVDRKEMEQRSFINRKEREPRSYREARSYDSSMAVSHDSRHKCYNVAPKLSEEERAAKLQEMQENAELHEEQRWKRLKKAEEEDAREANRASISGGRNFLDATQRSVYGTEKGGSLTIEESVRRRTHYSQGRFEVGSGNAFRR
ncbi:hypothetical protein JCGZ_19521 [Jatropha curcas]|uniref:CBF1-interacting co-repressor CIR N-terminal domain-containing protein n=1 Tax=Jatropha curcas TaxID=180498 RepID=A0A067K1M9_JATCU|nr:pre-mRNA-splicing factor CWC25 homolog [Jatropha curcas]XP_012082642.1 pre-mRNA-splicing factor CWC25 homolog [Jatropha curcas]KDP28958.1 hypothetical protein JCGZ_19521 [Jatropha curcas]